jgi:hypothetical protein
MRDSKKGYLQRLLSRQRKYTTSKVRKARTKSHRRKIVRTPAEKAMRVQQRRKSRETFSNDLKEARTVIMAEAVKLHQKHGGHNLNYYVELLYQNGHQKGERKVSDWNAWVHLESKRLNEGCVSLTVFLLTLEWFDSFRKW